MRIPHVYKPFVRICDDGGIRYAVVRFGLNEEDAEANSSVYFYEPHREELVWDAFLRMCAQQFLDLTFKEPW